ncbi:unnamed protein product [Urochloa humidicola]
MEAGPVSATYGFARSLPAKLERLLSPEAKHRLQLSQGEKKKIRLLKDKLQDLNNKYLLDPSKVEFPASAARCWVEEVRELSYDIDDFHDKLHAALQKNPGGSKFATLREGLRRSRWITAEISKFRTRLEKAIQRYKTFNLHANEKLQHSIITSSDERPAPLPRLYGLEAASPVGIGDSMGKMDKWLGEDGEPRLRGVAVVGPGGVGKTTLAKEIYSKLGKDFECRAFVRSSQMPDVRKLLTSILLQVRPHRRPDVSESRNLASTIKAHLQKKKYLIIIDDLWALSTWDLIHQALPDDDSCYSRILTTTEVDAVAHRCCGHNSMHILRMEPLSNDRLDELLSKFDVSQTGLSAVTFDNSTTSFINELSSEIISKCGGVPLAIVSIASLLERQRRDKIEPWNYIWSYLSSNLMTKPTVQGMKHVLSLCYDSLPDYLKTCILYLSLYKEDHIIWKDDLIKQWIAEGFICVKEGEDKEEVGSTYFDELVTKGMVQPVHISYNGKVLSFSVHYIVLQFIQCKSIKENFLIAINHSETNNIRLADKVHRLSLHFGDAEHAKPPENLRLMSQVRSLAFYGHFRSMACLTEFRLLRVLILDLWGDQDIIKLDFGAVCMLRYLEIACNVTLKLQVKWQCLQYLETLKIDSRISEVPQDIVHLPCLLHLTLPCETNLPDIDCMPSLRTFGCFDISTNSTDNVKSLEKLTNLHNLRLTCSTMLCENYEKNIGLFFSSVLSELSNLKSLILLPAESSSDANALGGSSLSNNVSFDCSSPPVHIEKLELSPRICIFPRLPSWIGHLPKLSILKIAARELSQSDIEILEKLDALSALLLYVRTAPQEKIMFHQGLLPKLKHFKFICSRFCLEFEKGALPEVRTLKIGFNTNRLGKYSSADAGITNLENLTVCNAKIGCAGGSETDRQAFQSALEDAFRGRDPERRPIINVQLVDSIFNGEKEMATVAEAEQPQTLEKVDVVMMERPKDQYGTRDIGSLEDKNSRAGRLTRSSDFPSSIENTGEDEKTWTTQKSPSGKDTRKDAESWTSMASEPFPYTQNQDYSNTETQLEALQSTSDTREEAPKVAYPSRESKSGNVADQGGDSRFNLPMGSYPYSQYAVKENRSEIQVDVEPPRQSQEKSHGAPERKSYDDATRQYSSRTREQPDSSSGIIILSTPEGTRWRPRNVYSSVEKALGIKYVSRQLAKLEALRAKNDIASIKLEMELMAIIIEENNGPGALPEKWVMQLQDLVHDIEDFIDVYNWLRVRSWRGTHAHMSRIVHLKNRTKIVREWQRNAISSKNEGIAAASGPSAGSTFDYWPQGNFIGMKSLKHELLQLVQSSGDYYESHQTPEVISIVGPRGVGKTALARSVYDEARARYDSDNTAWVVASECSSAGDLLSKITQQLHRQSTERRHHRRCLVVIDDLQQAGMWHDIENAFAGAERDSQIIVTTSIQSVAATCSMERYIYRVQGLNSNESRELFLRKIGREVDRTPAVEHALNEILIKCRGLPVALISIANYLRGQGQDLTERMAKFGNYLAGPSGAFDGMNRAFMKSYSHLPGSVHRSCLLSLSMFPQGHVIERKSLTRRWIAEGLVVGDGSLSAEHVANICFDDLIDRNIIEPVSIGINSKVKTVRVHDFLLEVIVNKSVSINFVALIRMDEPLHRGACPVRRLSVQGGTGESTRIARAIGLNRVRSLTVCRSVPLDLQNCRLLRVLDMEGCYEIDNSVVSAICGFVLLKYLSLRRTDVHRIPGAIRNLCDLETLDIRETRVGMLPTELLMLPRLAHLFGRFQLPQEFYNEKKRTKMQSFFEEKSRLETLSGFVVMADTTMFHMRLLRKLKIWCPDYITSDIVMHSTEISGPCRLSSIKLRGKLSRVPDFITRLAINLCELQLSSTGLSLEELSVLQKLPQLLYLKLAEDSDEFRGDSFVVERDGFPSLERLCFQAPKLPLVFIREGAMRSLKYLHLLCPLLNMRENTHYWQIENLPNLKEVVLSHIGDPDELEVWRQKACMHRNVINIVVQPQA